MDTTEDLILRSTKHVSQLPKNFALKTNFSANLKSLSPSSDYYMVTFAEVKKVYAR